MYTYHDEESDKYGKCQVNNSSLTNAAIKPWTRTQVESLIIYCSALEQQISENKTFNLLSLSSYRIELYFAHLRQVCIHNHTPENVKRVIEDDYIRQYLENYLHINNKSTRQQNRTGSTFHSQIGGTEISNERIRNAIYAGEMLWEYVMTPHTSIQQQSHTPLTDSTRSIFDEIMNYINYLGFLDWQVIKGRQINDNCIPELVVRDANNNHRVGLIMHANVCSGKIYKLIEIDTQGEGEE
ncbi:Conserved_hypothetical protein [Hexamita inflata]|uniref:Uncharacterized protein n=1 Tax=Hexamita inflata TaxID=28002 RepID=A0ABP1KSV9_9EUKA